MSHTNAPVPPSMIEDFAAHMRGADLRLTSTREWFEQLSGTAAAYLRAHGLPGRAVDAVAQYIDVKQSRQLPAT